jgi:hypothetical protein
MSWLEEYGKWDDRSKRQRNGKRTGKAIRRKGGMQMDTKGIQNIRKQLFCTSSLAGHALVQIKKGEKFCIPS